MLVLTSCHTVPSEIPEVNIVFPEFPNPTNLVKLDGETKTVYMPLHYWLSITEYVIEVRKVEAIIGSMK